MTKPPDSVKKVQYSTFLTRLVFEVYYLKCNGSGKGTHYEAITMHDLDNAIQNSKAIWDELYGKYGKEKMDQAFKYYNSTTDYLLDENAEKLEDIYYEILVAIESATDKDHDASFPIKVLRYEVRETFERLLDDLYPQ